MRAIFYVLFVAVAVIAGLWIKNKRNPFTGKYSAGKPSLTQWRTIIPGRWQVVEKEQAYDKTWLREMELEILPDNSFKLNGTEKYYNSSLYLVVGGGATGTWQLSDSSLMLNFSDCDFRISKNEYNSADQIHVLKCDNSAGITYGFASTLTFKSEIKELDQDRILITGENYGQGIDFTYEFNRIKE